MNNAAVSLDARPGFWSYFWTSCITLGIGWFAITFGANVRSLNGLLRGFGADIPAVTEFVISKAKLLWPLLLMLFIAQLALCGYFFIARNYAARRAVLLSSGVNVILQLILKAAFYLPMFKLGAPV